ncbi:MAG: NAD(P)/FAD-dependent oxidoreductase [Alphaproteobacteria bacterium]|nr:NAD(P)/FAD-dependent oxidoreductase [Alphaproteobacteria bacterium]
MTKKTQIVVVGGGAGGLPLARKLGAKYGRDRHDIILVDRFRSHIWKPLLHEVAAGSLDANLDEVGYGGHGHRWGYRFFYGSLESIDRENRQVITAPFIDERGKEVLARHRIRYDYLVLAYGGTSNDFGIPGVRENCLFLENRNQAEVFRQRLLNECFRVSLQTESGRDKDAAVRICIVGGGATGVELAAELFNAAKGLRDYGLEVFDESSLEVTLLEAGPRILPALPQKLADAARAELEALGVAVLTNTTVTKVDEQGVHTKDGYRIEADLRLWAAGVRGADIQGSLDGLEVNRSNQIVVGPTLQSKTDERIYAIGDCCSYIPEGADRPIPPRAQAASQMAITAYENLVAQMEDRPLKPFVYRDRGSLVSLSSFSTVGSLMGNLIGGRMAIEGRLARFAYNSLYRLHLLNVHGMIKGALMIALGHVNQVIRPKLKLH